MGAVLPVTLARVPHHTKQSINEKIRVETESRVAQAVEDGPEGVSGRLAELRAEWDIDRAAELHGGIAAIGGSALALTVSKKFFAIPMIIGASLVLGALFGWSPQYAILRRLGFRTAGEIERERNQLLSGGDGTANAGGKRATRGALGGDVDPLGGGDVIGNGGSLKDFDDADLQPADDSDVMLPPR